jgi:hypothetical protein
MLHTKSYKLDSILQTTFWILDLFVYKKKKYILASELLQRTLQYVLSLKFVCVFFSLKCKFSDIDLYIYEA